MITIIMDLNKNIKLTTSAPIYQFENNADEIMCLLPSMYGSFLLSECRARLMFSNGGITKDGYIELTYSIYNDNYLKFVGHTNINMTIADGDLKLWIELDNANHNFNLKTGCTSLYIAKSTYLSDTDVTKVLPILSQWVIQMNQIKNTASSVLQQATEQANRATMAASIATDMLNEMRGGKV